MAFSGDGKKCSECGRVWSTGSKCEWCNRPLSPVTKSGARKER